LIDDDHDYGYPDEGYHAGSTAGPLRRRSLNRGIGRDRHPRTVRARQAPPL